MGENFLFDLLFNAFFTVMIYSFPIFLIRYVFLRHAIQKKTALKIVIPYGIVTLFLVKFIILATTGDVNTTALPSLICGTLNYCMLISISKNDTETGPNSTGNQLNRKYVKKIRKEIKKVILPRISSFYKYPLTNCFEAVWMAVYDALGETDSINSQINIRRDAYLLLITATNDLLNSGNYQYNNGKLIPLGESILAVCDHSVSYAHNAAYITEDDDLYKSVRQTLDKLDTRQILDKMGYINKRQKDIDYVLDTQPSPISNNIWQEPLNNIDTSNDRDTSRNKKRKFKLIYVFFSVSQIVIVALIITVVVLFVKVNDLDSEYQYQKNRAEFFWEMYSELVDDYTVIQKKYKNAVNDYNSLVGKYNALIDFYREQFE